MGLLFELWSIHLFEGGLQRQASRMARDDPLRARIYGIVRFSGTLTQNAKRSGMLNDPDEITEQMQFHQHPRSSTARSPLLVDGMAWRPRYRSRAVLKRIRSFGFPQHLHSIRVTCRSTIQAYRILPWLSRRCSRVAHRDDLLTQRNDDDDDDDDDDDSSYCCPAIGNEMQDIEICPLNTQLGGIARHERFGLHDRSYPTLPEIWVLEEAPR